MKRVEKFEIRVVKGSQKGRAMYIGTIKAKDLCLLDDTGEYMFRCDTYDQITNPKGYQRLFAQNRADAFSRFLGYTAPQNEQALTTFSPTSILVNVRTEDRKNIDVREDRLIAKSNAIFWIVDGQARIEGIKQMLKEKKDLNNYEEFSDMDVPIIVTELNSKWEEAMLFAIFNKTQIGVKYDLVDQILKEQVDAGDVSARKMATMYDSAGIKIFNQVEERISAARIATVLNGTNDNPWYNNIKIANETSSASRGKIIRERSFDSSLVPLIDSMKNTSTTDEEMVKHVKLLWNCLREIMPEAFDSANKKNYVIQKSTGTSVFHKVYIKLLNTINENRVALVPQNEFVQGLKKIKQYIGSDPTRNFLDSAYWQSGGYAGNMGTSAKSFDKISKDINGTLQSFAESNRR